MAAAQLLLYVSKVTNLWAESQDASIQVNVEDGKASVDMHLSLVNLRLLHNSFSTMVEKNCVQHLIRRRRTNRSKEQEIN